MPGCRFPKRLVAILTMLKNQAYHQNISTRLAKQPHLLHMKHSYPLTLSLQTESIEEPRQPPRHQGEYTNMDQFDIAWSYTTSLIYFIAELYHKILKDF